MYYSLSIADFKKAKKCVVYLRDTSHLAMVYQLNVVKTWKLTMYVDSSFGNGEKRRSIYGFIIFLNNMILHYKSKQQPLVALSTTEAEFISLALGMKEMKWIKSMLLEMKVELETAIVYSDNQRAIKIAKNTTSAGRTKHIDIKLQFEK